MTPAGLQLDVSELGIYGFIPNEQLKGSSYKNEHARRREAESAEWKPGKTMRVAAGVDRLCAGKRSVRACRAVTGIPRRHVAGRGSGAETPIAGGIDAYSANFPDGRLFPFI